MQNLSFGFSLMSDSCKTSRGRSKTCIPRGSYLSEVFKLNLESESIFNHLVAAVAGPSGCVCSGRGCDVLCSAFTASRSTSCDLSLDPKTEMGRNIDDRSLWWKNGMVANRQQVCDRLVLVLPGYFLVFGAAKCILLQATMPAVTFRLLQQAFLTRRFAFQATSFQGPRRAGHPHSGPFVAVQHTRARVFRAPRAHACVCPRSDFLAAAYRLPVRTYPLVAALRVCACPCVPAPRALTRPLAAASPCCAWTRLCLSTAA